MPFSEPHVSRYVVINKCNKDTQVGTFGLAVKVQVAVKDRAVSKAA